MNYQPPRHKRTFRLVAPLTAGLSILLVFSAFGGSSAFGSGTSTKTQQMSTAPIVKGSGGTVIVRAQEDIDTFNPAIDNGTYLDFSTYAFTYDTLATLSPQGNLRPGNQVDRYTLEGDVLDSQRRHLRRRYACNARSHRQFNELLRQSEDRRRHRKRNLRTRQRARDRQCGR